MTVKWMELGLNLGLNYNTKLKCIEKDYSKAEEQLRECIAVWLNFTVRPTWEALVDALNAIGEFHTAEEIKRKYT